MDSMNDSIVGLTPDVDHEKRIGERLYGNGGYCVYTIVKATSKPITPEYKNPRGTSRSFNFTRDCFEPETLAPVRKRDVRRKSVSRL